MNLKTLKTAAIILALVVVFVVIGRQILKAMDLSVKNLKPYVYDKRTNSTAKYIAWITPIAKAIGAEFGIPWKAIVVQTALETGWGSSSLLRKYNNFGGIKAVKGDSSVSMGTQEFVNGQMITITDAFAVWKTPYEGLQGYAKFFHRNKRYATALHFPNDPYKFIEEIKKAGYATDPNYVAKLHGMLNKYLLKA